MHFKYRQIQGKCVVIMLYIYTIICFLCEIGKSQGIMYHLILEKGGGYYGERLYHVHLSFRIYNWRRGN